MRLLVESAYFTAALRPDWEEMQDETLPCAQWNGSPGRVRGSRSTPHC